jgi:peptidoglycan/xylan/chitin deacetylase (PgdA/CDA1 family)
MIHGVSTAEFPDETFCKQIDYLNKAFGIISMDEAIDSSQARNHPTRTRIVLTFDDGLRSMFLQAYPFLKQQRIPATVYVCPGLIERGGWLWNHEVYARLSDLHSGRVSAIASRIGTERSTPRPLVEWMKKLPFARRLQVEDLIRQETPDFRPTAEQHQRYDLMTWEELRQMDPSLVTIGSHSMHHSILTSTDGAELEYEIVESRRLLESMLKAKVQHFCFPNGDYDGTSMRIVTQNYASATLTVEGVVKADTSPFELPRVPIADSLRSTAWRMHRPQS